MSGIEGIGEAVTGGMFARAIEPAAGEGKAPGDGAGNDACLNCGTALVGDYCHRCGQRGHVHRSLSAFFHDLLHGVLHIEGKIWRTLPMLLFKPGDLTRRYIAGERARFVSPMAMFLFSVFLMFAVFSTMGPPFAGSVPANAAAAVRAEFVAERREDRAALGRAEARLAKARAAGEATAAAQARIAEVRARMADRDKQYIEDIVGARQAANYVNVDSKDFRAVGFTTGVKWIDEGIAKANANPSLLLYKLQANAYKFSWALIPISVPFVWLAFFWRRRYKLYDHTVFVTYSIAFMSLGAVMMSLIRPIDPDDTIAGLALVFVPPVHMYKQLRGAYGLGRFGALVRTFYLLVAASVAATLFLMLLLGLGVLG